MSSIQFSRRPRWLSVIVASAIAVSSSSCAPTTPVSSSEASQPEASQPDASPTETAELQVVTTFLPITQFTKAVAGDRAEVTQLLPPNVGPHDYQAKPDDVQRLAQADVLVQNGLELEEFLEDLVANADNPDLTIVNSSEGIATISTEEIAGHNEAEEHEHAGDGHQHGELNPHVWLDPKRAIEQVENIRDGLIAADPQGQPEYTANAAAYIEQLQALDADITSTLQPYAGKTFVAFHDFAPYFAQSYRLKAEFLVDAPEENPSPEDVKRISDEVKASNLKTILTEPQAGEEALAALAQDLNVTISEFDSMETGGSEATEPEYYITIMRQNVESLVNAFGGSL
ncbi:MAG: zinc ABC transporter substrate-binding protein [Oculatellaceae cyanobacterium bins.114]|nr:zinc ABC transporter substrate-binding protein [Oculatellaceae cyanobacterium bins.114]